MFEFKQQWAVRPRDLQRAILDWNPQIVHFSGHGMGESGLVLEADRSISSDVERKFTAIGEGGLALEDDNGQMQLVSADALAGLFELFADRVECVLLNACYSEVQAKAIVKHIPYAIGMNQAVGDVAARVFAVAFYDALGAGEGIEFAYKSGCVAIKLAGIPGSLTPVLRKKLIAEETNLSSGFPSPKNITSLKRLEIKLKDLEEEYTEACKKLQWLKKERIIKTDSEAKYELDRRIDEYEQRIEVIEEELRRVEEELK